MKKKRQHHVPQFYLNRWSRDGKLYALRGNEILHTSSLNLANQRYFYAINAIEVEDVAPYFSFLSRKGEDELHEQLLDWVDDYANVVHIHNQMKEGGAQKHRLFPKFDEMRVNWLEDEHGLYEKILHVFLEMLDEELLELYEHDVLEDFLLVLMLQFSRTKRNKADHEGFAKAQKLPWMAKTWHISSRIFAKYLATRLFRQRQDYRLVLIRNLTEMPFITGDQPVVNINFQRHTPQESGTFEAFYPIRPDRAVMLIKRQSTENDIWDVTEVARIRRLNQLIADHALDELYADRPEVLEMYRPFRTTEAGQPAADTELQIGLL